VPAATVAVKASATTHAGSPDSSTDSSTNVVHPAPAVAPRPVATLSVLERQEEVVRVRTALKSPEPRERLRALRRARDLHEPSLEADVRVLLAQETSAPARRVGVQVLALGDVTANRATLETLAREDKDPIVNINASFGLARAGDERRQAWLLLLLETSKRASPNLAPILANALEAPELRAPIVVARFQAIANDTSRDPKIRERARAIVRAKLGS